MFLFNFFITEKGSGVIDVNLRQYVFNNIIHRSTILDGSSLQSTLIKKLIMLFAA